MHTTVRCRVGTGWSGGESPARRIRGGGFGSGAQGFPDALQGEDHRDEGRGKDPAARIRQGCGAGGRVTRGSPQQRPTDERLPTP